MAVFTLRTQSKSSIVLTSMLKPKLNIIINQSKLKMLIMEVHMDMKR